jgi:transcriptional regulator with XRE-family HTH domain
MLVEEPRARRQRLAAELRGLREIAGLSGRRLAELIDISQSKVSRIESGSTLPSVRQVAAWVEAVGGSAETRARLTEFTEAAFAEVQAWRTATPSRAVLQSEVQAREASARIVRVFQPFLVPGMLQTAEYARRVFSFFHLPYDGNDLAKAVAGRMDRQLALYEEDRRFGFLITEAALRWRPGPARVVRGQLDRIASLATLESVTIGLIPMDTESNIVTPPGFDLLSEDDGETIVTIETVHANLMVTDPNHTAEYETAWSTLSQLAVYDEAASLLLDRIRTSITDHAG